MGFSFSKFFTGLFGKRELKILMVGLDAAGKTTILYKMKLGEVVSTIPTLGFNLESVEFNNLSFLVWDVGGQDKIRPLWRHYYQNAQGFIFVVDSADKDRFSEAADELQKIINEEELKHCPVLIFANKQDLEYAASVEELEKALGLAEVKGRSYLIQPSTALTGDGLKEGFEWLSTQIKD